MRPCSQCVRMRNRLPFHPNPLLSHNQKQHPTSQMNSCLCACLVVMHKQEAPCTNGHAHPTSQTGHQDLFAGPYNEIFDLIFWKGGVRCKNGVEYITEYKLTVELRGNDNTDHQEGTGQKQEKEDTYQWRPWTKGRRLGYSKLGTLYHLRKLSTARTSEQRIEQ